MPLLVLATGNNTVVLLDDRSPCQEHLDVVHGRITNPQRIWLTRAHRCDIWLQINVFFIKQNCHFRNMPRYVLEHIL
uniref:Uncharacterized protein n=1 Tax=Physcomitrium patens TaxID=3218 RepID=A0A2K1L6P9_PHYPA|nr:hypothetical protein PHYPA_000139 [Physcomitrium patens]